LQLVAMSSLARYSLILLMIAFIAYACWRIIRPSVVVELDSTGMSFRGVRPGAWKLFQLWKKIYLRNADITEIRIGKIRKAPLEQDSYSADRRAIERRDISKVSVGTLQH
jgi:hypothetical protein